MDGEDARLIYEAVRIARPGGLGTTSEMDIYQDPPADVLQAMSYSSDEDLIARQYSNGFQQVFEEVVPLLSAGQASLGNLSDGIIYAHVSMIARYGDSLIQRKCGLETSDKARMLAQKALESLMANRQEWYDCVGELDFWLRSDGHRRNPGTTADLITAGIFAGIVNDQISAPFV